MWLADCAVIERLLSAWWTICAVCYCLLSTWWAVCALISACHGSRRVSRREGASLQHGGPVAVEFGLELRLQHCCLRHLSPAAHLPYISGCTTLRGSPWDRTLFLRITARELWFHEKRVPEPFDLSLTLLLSFLENSMSRSAPRRLEEALGLKSSLRAVEGAQWAQLFSEAPRQCLVPKCPHNWS